MRGARSNPGPYRDRDQQGKSSGIGGGWRGLPRGRTGGPDTRQPAPGNRLPPHIPAGLETHYQGRGDRLCRFLMLSRPLLSGASLGRGRSPSWTSLLSWASVPLPCTGGGGKPLLTSCPLRSPRKPRRRVGRDVARRVRLRGSQEAPCAVARSCRRGVRLVGLHSALRAFQRLPGLTRSRSQYRWHWSRPSPSQS